MIKEAIEYIVGLKKASEAVIEVDGRKYAVNNGTLVPVRQPEPKTMHFSTLTGLVDWARTYGKEILSDDPYFVVDRYNEVSLHSKLLEAFKQRPLIAVAMHNSPSFQYSSYMDTEEFIVATQVRFEMTESLEKLLAIVGNVKESAVRTLADDGISQTVTATAGRVAVEKVTLPNPVYLKPFKAFSEIETPTLPHIFRGKDGPHWALFEGDDAAWAAETKTRIGSWIAKNSKFKVYA